MEVLLGILLGICIYCAIIGLEIYLMKVKGDLGE